MKQKTRELIAKIRTLGYAGRAIGTACDLAMHAKQKIRRCVTAYPSQFGQDKFVDEYFSHQPGFYVDVGAHNGVDLSNTLFLQKRRQWKGICIEPNPTLFKQLQARRSGPSCLCLPFALDSQPGEGEFIEADWYGTLKTRLTPQHQRTFLDHRTSTTTNVQVRTLQQVLTGITHVDYLSLDTEGNELEILKGVNWDAVKFEVLGVENNWGDESIRKYLEERSYRFHHRMGVDDFYVRK